jgi:hypothetical protein
MHARGHAERVLFALWWAKRVHGTHGRHCLTINGYGGAHIKSLATLRVLIAKRVVEHEERELTLNAPRLGSSRGMKRLSRYCWVLSHRSCEVRQVHDRQQHRFPDAERVCCRGTCERLSVIMHGHS